MSLTIFNRLPECIIRECILPYTYMYQPKKLMYDIKSYVIDYSLILSVYFTSYNECILLNDLMELVNNIDRYIEINTNRGKIFLRLYSNNYLFDNSYDNYKEEFFRAIHTKNIMRKIRMIWGILTPRERTIFFNTYILHDLEE